VSVLQRSGRRAPHDRPRPRQRPLRLLRGEEHRSARSALRLPPEDLKYRSLRHGPTNLGALSMSVPTPKSLPIRRLSLSVMSCLKVVVGRGRAIVDEPQDGSREVSVVRPGAGRAGAAELVVRQRPCRGRTEGSGTSCAAPGHPRSHTACRLGRRRLPRRRGCPAAAAPRRSGPEGRGPRHSERHAA
jgi:hypothetical protein